MVIDRLAGVVGIVLMPYQFYKHLIGEHPFVVWDKQGEDFKFFDG